MAGVLSFCVGWAVPDFRREPKEGAARPSKLEVSAMPETGKENPGGKGPNHGTGLPIEKPKGR